MRHHGGVRRTVPLRLGGFGSAAHPAGRAGLSTATVGIGSGKDQVTGDALPAGRPEHGEHQPGHPAAGRGDRVLFEHAEGGVGPAVDAGRDVPEGIACLLPGGGAAPATAGRHPAVTGVHGANVGAVQAVLDQPLRRLRPPLLAAALLLAR